MGLPLTIEIVVSSFVNLYHYQYDLSLLFGLLPIRCVSETLRCNSLLRDDEEKGNISKS